MTINEIKNENGMLHLNIAICDRDFHNHFIRCADCGTIIFKSDAVEVSDDYYCSDCITTCFSCGEIIPKDEVYTVADSGGEYCRHCYENETYTCDDCGTHFRYGDSLMQINGYSYCDDCKDNHRSLIDDYHAMKESGDIVFYGDADRREDLHIGIEIETDCDHCVDRERIASGLKERFGDFMTYENDGSLSWGFECITHPATLNYHLSMMPKYKEAFAYLTDNDMKGHDISTTGMHCHLDRNYFGEKEDSSIAKFLYIFEKFRSQLMVFSRRTENQANDWARSRKKCNANSGWIKKAVKDSKNYYDRSERYYAVNLTNPDTLEIRLWKSSLNIETFEATLKFTNRIAEICKNTSAVELSKMKFEDLLGNDKTILSYWSRVKNRRTNRGDEF